MTAPLANRTYRILFVAQIVALVGTGLSTIALALLAYDLADGNAGTVLGIALALKMIAYVDCWLYHWRWQQPVPWLSLIPWFMYAITREAPKAIQP